MPEDKPVTPPEEKLTPAQELELEKLRSERVKSEERIAELQKQNRDLTLVTTFEKAIAATGIRSEMPQKDLIKLVTAQEGVTVVPSADGAELHCELDGKPVNFSELLEAFAIKEANQYLFDRRSLRRLKQDEHKVTCKDDLTSKEDVMNFLSANGEDAFARLPQHRPTHHADPGKTMTAAEYKALTVSQKAALCGQLSELQLTRILQRVPKEKK